MLLMYLKRLLIVVTFCFGTAQANGQSPSLANAVENLDTHRIDVLLQENVDANVSQVDGMTALHWATYHDKEALVKRLLQANANASAKSRYGIEPITLACVNGNASILKMLLDAGANPNCVAAGGESALMTASRTGRVTLVNLLISRGAEVNAKETNGQTAIMWAANEGHLDVVEALIAAGADFKTPLRSGFTPLFFAVREGHIEVARLLLNKGVEINGTMEPTKTFRKSPKSGTSPLTLAVENGHFELAVALLESGADPNDQRSGFTPLHILTWVRKPNRGDGVDGDPAPIGSGRLNSLEFVRKLVEHGADVNVRLKKGRRGRGRLSHKGATPLLFAAKSADLEYIKLLVELGADPFLTNDDNCTPLMAAAGIGTIAPGEEAGTEPEAFSTVQYFLQLGADPNHVDKKKETAMHGAAYKSLPSVVRLLYEGGADIKIWNKKNRYGWTPLLIAQGFRPGNFKPSFETIEAIQEIMLREGVEPPKAPTRVKRLGYENR